MLKPVVRVAPAGAHQWVGDAFPVRTAFSIHDGALDLSPFLLLDYAGPAEFPPCEVPRATGAHRYKGFDIVTLVYQGELEYIESDGHCARVGPGDAHWQTAASGVVQDTRHSHAFSERGGTLEAVHLWVNLPARHKHGPVRRQMFGEADIPTVHIADGLARARVIAGDLCSVKGAARTFTPMNVWDVQLRRGGLHLDLPDGFATALFVLHGLVTINDEHRVGDATLVVFHMEGDGVHIEGHDERTLLLVLSGHPIDEPVVAYGPFVMNTRHELRQAIRELESR